MTTDHELMITAEEMCCRAYAPYSGFKVGSALLTESGNVYTGCNVENSSYGCCICAERTAAVKAISEGDTRFTAIAVANSAGGETYPCGICLQFLSEFSGEDFRIILRDKGGSIVSYRLGELMPKGFILVNN